MANKPPLDKASRFNIQRFFQALGDATRLRLLNLMGDQELCVCYFVEILKQPQPKIAGIVEARREGKWMHYRITPPQDAGAAQLLRQTLAWLKQDRAMQADRARLGKACCTPAMFVTLKSAPQPTSITRTRKGR